MTVVMGSLNTLDSFRTLLASARLDKAEADCWEWLGARNGQGYGTIRINYVNHRAHRLAYALHHGLEEAHLKGLEVHHRCRNKLCVNPAHLECMTTSEHSRLHNLEGRLAHVYDARRARTHCHQGHELSGDNLKLKTDRRGNTERICAACEREYRLRRYHEERRDQGLPSVSGYGTFGVLAGEERGSGQVVSHCKRGHEYDDENTGWRTSQGKRVRYCKACKNQRRSKGNRHEDRTHCPRGHEYTEENTYLAFNKWSGNYNRQCKACRNERNAARARATVAHVDRAAQSRSILPYLLTPTTAARARSASGAPPLPLPKEETT